MILDSRKHLQYYNLVNGSGTKGSILESDRKQPKSKEQI